MDTLAQILRGLLGMAAILGVAYAFSASRRGVNWRLVAGGLVLQLAVAVLLLKEVPGVNEVFSFVAGGFVMLLGFTAAGSEFVFGKLGLPSPENGFIFAFHALPTVIFISALSSLLYYFGILQLLVKAIAWVMSRAMRLSGAESLSAAANVFVGQTEAPLLVKPYIPTLSKSEMLALMVGGMATIAGSVFAIYVGFLGGTPEETEAFARVLLCASLMNAPAALLIAKIMLPETERVNRNLNVSRDKLGVNAIDAFANGTSEGLKLALNIAAMLIAFLAMIAMANALLGWVGGWTGLNAWVEGASGETFSELSLEALCGFLFAPVAWLIGVGGGDVLQVGQLIGFKVIVNEFVAFENLGALKEAGALDPRSVFITTFALCGFANFSSIGIQIGGIGALAPGRRGELAQLGIKALVGGTLASLLSASVAGILYSG